MLLTILVFLLVLSVLVLVHELGHYLVAKKLGVKVEEFGFGFPPRVWGKKIGETIYSINLLPIGGFVKLYGEDDAGGGKITKIKNQKSNLKNDRRAFYTRSVWQRAAIVVAGVVMNFLLAVAIISYLFSVQGVPVQGKDVTISAVLKNTPADTSGLKVNDIIVAINGTKVTDPKQVTSITRANLGKKILLVLRDKRGTVRQVYVTPRVYYPGNQGPMGIAISVSVTIKKYPWYQSPFIGVVESFKESWIIMQGIGTTIVQIFFQRTVPQGVGGPVAIAELTGQFVKVGFDAILSLVSLLSLNLAVVNILPIPALDGGRFFFILIEAVTRRKVNARFEAYAHTVGMILLLILLAFLTFHDILRTISGQPLIPKM